MVMDIWGIVELSYHILCSVLLCIPGTGTIPGSFGALNALTVLDVAGNHLTGSIPGSLLYITTLELFILSSNSFTGKFTCGAM